ncbi:hypothetical protein V6L77_00425 [Pannonibacter sp. Pt2-lr]
MQGAALAWVLGWACFTCAFRPAVSGPIPARPSARGWREALSASSGGQAPAPEARILRFKTRDEAIIAVTTGKVPVLSTPSVADLGIRPQHHAAPRHKRGALRLRAA